MTKDATTTDRPIPFVAPMIRALLDGRKTMTRRVTWRIDKNGNEVATKWRDLYMDWMFRSVEGYPDYYAGRDGLIYSLKGSSAPRPMKGSPSSKGYLTVSLCGPDGIKTKSVHRAVAEAWLGPPPAPSYEIRHLNADRTDNRIENLDWGTASDNWSDRRALGNGIHEDHHAAKITMTDADAIRTSSLSQRKIAAMYGVSQSLVCDIRKGRIWRRAPAATGRNIALPDSPRLWVREAIVHAPMGAGFDTTHWPHGTVAYLADGKGEWFDRAKAAGAKSRPSIHMPRWASRLTLIVEDVRVERLQEISEADARAEGCRGRLGPNPDFPDEWDPSPQEEFSDLWRSLHGPDAWAANPFVAVISFRVIRANIDSEEARA